MLNIREKGYTFIKWKKVCLIAAKRLLDLKKGVYSQLKQKTFRFHCIYNFKEKYS